MHATRALDGHTVGVLTYLDSISPFAPRRDWCGLYRMDKMKPTRSAPLHPEGRRHCRHSKLRASKARGLISAAKENPASAGRQWPPRASVPISGNAAGKTARRGFQRHHLASARQRREPKRCFRVSLGCGHFERLGDFSGIPGLGDCQGRGGANFGAETHLHRCCPTLNPKATTCNGSFHRCSRLRPTPPMRRRNLERPLKAAYDSPEFKTGWRKLDT